MGAAMWALAMADDFTHLYSRVNGSECAKNTMLNAATIYFHSIYGCVHCNLFPSYGKV
jgi:hypothetical protein